MGSFPRRIKQLWASRRFRISLVLLWLAPVYFLPRKESNLAVIFILSEKSCHENL